MLAATILNAPLATSLAATILNAALKFAVGLISGRELHQFVGLVSCFVEYQTP